MTKIEWKRTRNDCHEVISHMPNGHGYIYLSSVGYVHRWKWEKENGPIPDGMLVCHHCDNPKCINLAHLFLGTIADNIADMFNKGRGKTTFKGEAHPNAKLTNKQVSFIRKHYHKVGNRSNMYTLAAMFNVGYECVRRIVKNKRWVNSTHSP